MRFLVLPSQDAHYFLPQNGCEKIIINMVTTVITVCGIPWSR